MMMLAITAVLIGAMLGMRFKILILLPATVIGSSATLGVGVAHSAGFWSILLAMVLAIAALQVGYLAGTVVIASSRVGKDSPVTVVVAQKPAG